MMFLHCFRNQFILSIIEPQLSCNLTRTQYSSFQNSFPHSSVGGGELESARTHLIDLIVGGSQINTFNTFNWASEQHSQQLANWRARAHNDCVRKILILLAHSPLEMWYCAFDDVE